MNGKRAKQIRRLAKYEHDRLTIAERTKVSLRRLYQFGKEMHNQGELKIGVKQ